MKSRILSVDELRLDGDTQARVKIHEETVEDYTEKIQDADGDWPLGELDVFHDGSDYFVADGFHRTLAALRAKRGSVPCRIHKGTAIDAKIFGMTANDRHGLRMSRADKRGCVEWLLDNGGKLTQVEVAQKAGVTRQTVAKIIADRKPADVKFNIPKTTEGPVKPQSAAPESAGASETDPGNDVGREGDSVAAETGKAAAASPDPEGRWKAAIRDLNQVLPLVESDKKRKASALRKIANKLDPPTKFVPPTLDEVRAYCTERANKLDPEAFVAHYESNGWRVGKGTGKPMQDWRASVVTWEKMGKTNGRQNGQVTSRVHGGVDYSEYEL